MRYVTLNHGGGCPSRAPASARSQTRPRARTLRAVSLRPAAASSTQPPPASGEEAVGRAVKRSGIAREECRITTRAPGAGRGTKTRSGPVSAPWSAPARRPGPLLFHQPLGDSYGSWRTMGEQPGRSASAPSVCATSCPTALRASWIAMRSPRPSIRWRSIRPPARGRPGARASAACRCGPGVPLPGVGTTASAMRRSGRSPWPTAAAPLRWRRAGCAARRRLQPQDRAQGARRGEHAGP